MNKYGLNENRYNAATNSSSWDIIEVNTNNIIASFYYKLPARDRLRAKSRAEDYLRILNSKEVNT
jgi:hypothetical protein